MKTVLLACATIEAEIHAAIQRCQAQDIEIRWVASGLHDSPERLRDAIQQELSRIHDAERILLGFGFCGNAMLGVKAGNCPLILPRVGDCITLLLGGQPARDQAEKDGSTYFLTPGWLSSERNLYTDYLYSLSKYGEEMTAEIYHTLLAHYRYLGIVKTGAYDFDAFYEQAKPVAKALNLTLRSVEGTLRYIDRLLLGPWDTPLFVTVPENETITADMLDLTLS